VRIALTLEGVNAKIDRAEGQRVSLVDEIRAFEADLTAKIENEKRPATGQQVWVFRGETPSVPASWSIRIGEFLYNLRSGLDHLVWQLVLANGETPGTRNQFPIYRDENKYERESRSRLRGVSDHAAEIIRELQPFVGRRDNLWRLQSLGNFDKHRHLNFCTAVVDGGRLSGSGPRLQELADTGGIKTKFGRLEKDQVLLTVDDLEYSLNAMPDVEVRFEQPIPNVHLLPVANNLFTCWYGARMAVDSLVTEVVDRGPGINEI